MKNILLLIGGVLFGVQAYLALYLIQGALTYSQPTEVYYWIAAYVISLILLGFQIIKLIQQK